MLTCSKIEIIGTAITVTGNKFEANQKRKAINNIYIANTLKQKFNNIVSKKKT